MQPEKKVRSVYCNLLTALFNCLYTVKLQQNFCLIHMVGSTQKENVPPKGKGANKTTGKKKGKDILF